MTEQKQRRGFALLSPERLREISRKGGETAQATGVGHKFTPEEARAAGRKGGRVIAEKKRLAKERIGHAPAASDAPTVTGESA